MLTLTTVDLQYARRVAVRAAEGAGRLMRDRACRGGPVAMRRKDLSGDVVSELDVAAERLIVGELQAAFPGHRVIAEEGGTSGADDDRWTWLVDPLDGTNNVAIGLSAYVVGIALCADRRPVVGVVHDPVCRQTWSTVRGRGVLLDDTAPPPRRQRVGGPPVLAWTQGHSVRRDDPTARSLKLVLESAARRVLQLWAPLLSWVMLARGDIDGIVGYEPESIDQPAGLLLAREAGMAIRRLDGSDFDDRFDASPAGRSFVAGPPESIERLVKLAAAAQWIEADVRRLNLSEQYG